MLVVPPIGLHRVKEKKDYTKGEYNTAKLRNTPSDPNSVLFFTKSRYATAKLRNIPSDPNFVPFFKSGSPEEWLIFKARYKRVFTGQNMTTAVQKYAYANRFLQGQALGANAQP